MKDHDVTVNQMQWQPALLKLTYTPHPDVDDGEPTPCYVCPQWITGISRQAMKFGKVDAPSESYPAKTCTAVVISSSIIYYVIETPEQVALMRDRALGHEPKLERV